MTALVRLEGTTPKEGRMDLRRLVGRVIPHCWHSTGVCQSHTFATWWIEVCCHCGENRTVTDRVVTPPGHGRHLPTGAQGIDRVYSEHRPDCYRE